MSVSLHLPIALAVVAVLAGGSRAMAVQRGTRQTAARQNPLVAPSTLPFHAPAFDRIQDRDFLPAIEEGIRRLRAEIRKIANNPAPPTFDNTIVALERSGQLLTRASMMLNGLAGANTNDTLQKVQEDVAP